MPKVSKGSKKANFVSEDSKPQRHTKKRRKKREEEEASIVVGTSLNRPGRTTILEYEASDMLNGVFDERIACFWGGSLKHRHKRSQREHFYAAAVEGFENDHIEEALPFDERALSPLPPIE